MHLNFSATHIRGRSYILSAVSYWTSRTIEPFDHFKCWNRIQLENTEVAWRKLVTSVTTVLRQTLGKINLSFSLLNQTCYPHYPLNRTLNRTSFISLSTPSKLPILPILGTLHLKLDQCSGTKKRIFGVAKNKQGSMLPLTTVPLNWTSTSSI